MSVNLEVIDDFAYFVSKEDELIRLDLVGIHQQTSNGREIDDKLLHEQIVCEGVNLICSRGKSLTILTYEGVVSNLDTLDNRLDLSAACGEPTYWTAIGRRGNKAVAAGYYESTKKVVLVLIETNTMRVINHLEMTKAETSEHRIRHVLMIEVEK